MKKKWTMVTVAALSFLAACNEVDDENEATQTDENDETVETAGVTDGNGGFFYGKLNMKIPTFTCKERFM